MNLNERVRENLKVSGNVFGVSGGMEASDLERGRVAKRTLGEVMQRRRPWCFSGLEPSGVRVWQ